MASHVPQGYSWGRHRPKPLPFCGVDALATVALDLRPLLQTTVCVCRVQLYNLLGQGFSLQVLGAVARAGRRSEPRPCSVAIPAFAPATRNPRRRHLNSVLAQLDALLPTVLAQRCS